MFFEVDPAPGTGGLREEEFVRGRTQYELSNHLGNVLVTISDNRVSVDDGTYDVITICPSCLPGYPCLVCYNEYIPVSGTADGIIDYYTAVVLTANDYYPFGMGMPGRKYSADGAYRYGFNGQEKTLEIASNTTTAEFWQYDARIGRRWNLDPVFKDNESPYLCFGGNAVLLSDVNGDCAHGGGDCPYCGRNHNPGSGGSLIGTIENWLYGIKVDLTCGRRWNEAVTNVNRGINPIYNVAALTVGEENLDLPSHMIPMSRQDAAFNLVTQWMWWKYAKLASASNTSAQMERQMGNVSSGPPAKHPTQQPVLGKISTSSTVSIPQGITEEQFKIMSQRIANQTGHLSTDVVVQGSRAAGTATAYSDIDIAIKVSRSQFDDLIKQAFGTPNPGSALERTMNHAIKTGKIQAGEAGLSGLHKNLQKFLGIDVDISIIKIGGQFDNGAQIPIKAVVPSGVR